MRQITETIVVEVQSTKEELNQAFTGNSIPPLAALIQRYQTMKETYIKGGYTIVSENFDTFTFTAKKITVV